MTKEQIKESMKIVELIDTLETGLNTNNFWVCFQSQWLFEETFRKALAAEVNERLQTHVQERLQAAQSKLKDLGVT